MTMRQPSPSDAQRGQRHAHAGSHRRSDVHRRRQRRRYDDIHGHAGRHQRGLNGLQYVPPVDFTGTANLQISTNDLASILAGGPKTDANTIAINVANPSSYSGLLGMYYNNLDATGTPVYRVDSTVNFNWGTQGSPAPGISGTNWSASWQGQVLADYTGTYTFYGTADDGVRVWVNGQLLCDGWNCQAATTYSGTIDLQAGQSYSIRMDYFQGGGGEMAKLEWAADSQGNEQTSHLRKEPQLRRFGAERERGTLH